MGLLDKLKPQPRWKHADPAVRLEALRELADPVELAILAESDPDARVRRAAAPRLEDPAVLGRIASADPDADAREAATDRLLTLASGVVDEPTAVAAVGQLSDPRRLSTIAKSEAAPAVAIAALARTTDERALGAIARTATHETVALAAVGRLTDRGELVETATSSVHRDVALAAFDRAVAPTRDVAELKTIESHTTQKAVAKRARGIVQEIEDAAAAARAAEEARQHEQALVCADVERLVHVADIAAARADLARLGDAWRALGDADPATTARFERATGDVRAALLRREREAEEAVERERMRAEALASRDALCARVETLDGDHIPEQLSSIEEEWRSLTPLVGNSPEADRLAERFAVAVTACRKRHELSAALAGTRASLGTLVTEAEGLLSHADGPDPVARWQALSREARVLTAILSDAARPEPDLEARLVVVDQAFAAREDARQQAAAKAQQDLVGRLQRLIDRTARASEAETVTLREGDRLMRDIGLALDEATKSSSRKDEATKSSSRKDEAAKSSSRRDESTKSAADKREPNPDLEAAVSRLREQQSAIAPRVRELREMDEWRRFANAQQQERLIAMAAAIVASLKSDEETGKTSDLAATARALKELHAKWQEVADAPRQSAQRLWDRFRTETDFIRSRCETYFVKQREELATNLTRKTAIVDEAEALAQSADWTKATARFQELQTEWRALGAVPRSDARDLAQRFRTACNAFFSRRREDLTARKKVWTDNLAKKDALCLRAEALAESMDWEAASAEMKRLQAEWKTVGPVRRAKSEAVWARFRTAADHFFQRYHNRHQITMTSKLAERETLVSTLEALLNADEPPVDLAAQVEGLRSTWNRSVPIPAAEMTPIAERWRTAFTALLDRRGGAFAGTDLDPSAIHRRMEKLVAKVEELVRDTHETASASQTSQTEVLAARLRSAFATNAMGGRSSDESKWRAAADLVKDAQGAWARLVPLGDPAARSLDARFREACRRVLDQARRHSGPGSSAARRGPNSSRVSAAAG
jgi:hypothetical protein